MQEKGTFCVLARGPNGTKDLPIRSAHIRVLTTKYEHPRIISLLQAAKNQLRPLGLGEDNKSIRAIQFRHFLGDMIRGVGSVLVVKNWRVQNGKVAGACIAISMGKVFGERQYVEAMMKLNLDEGFVEKIAVLDKVRI